MPGLLVQIALIIIAARCAYVVFTMLNRHRKPWWEIAFYLSGVIVALSFLF